MNTGRTHFKKGFTPWNKDKKGYKLIRKVNLKGVRQSPRTEFKKGEHPSPKTEFKKGHKMVKAVREKIRNTLKGKYTGTMSSQWKGGISFEPYSPSWTNELKQAIRQRDNFT